VSPTSLVDDTIQVFKRVAIWPDAPMEIELAKRLEKVQGKPGRLRIKLGLDPSSPDLHVGHAVLLLLLRDLQRLGHTIVLIVGDATAMVGDPSGRNKLRPQLSRADVNANLATYTAQAGILLDMQRTEVRRNAEWFDALNFEGLLRLLGRRTVAQTLAREDFQKRLAEDVPIGLHELFYPVMQGWDSVMVRSDVELGGTDQLFNLLVGRDLQVQEGQEPQIVAMTPLINGTDGRKMSKSYGNAIGLTDPPGEIFGKTMRLPDPAMEVWFNLLTRIPAEEYRGLLAGDLRAAKARLAWELVQLVHGRAAADHARDEFDRVHKHKERPAEIPEASFALPAEGAPLAVVLREIKLASSGSEARRLITQGGVRVDDEVVRDPNALLKPVKPGFLLQVGPRRFLRLVVSTSAT